MNFLLVGAICGFLGVALGAFGGHILKARIPADRLKVYEVGVTYHMYHALALVAVGILARAGICGRGVNVAGWLFLVGIILFSGSLYAMSLSGKRALGAITPIGGLCFLVGWVMIIVGAA